MKSKINKHILEAVHKGIQLALDDYEDNDLNSNIRSKDEIIKNDEEILHHIIDVIDLGLPSGTLWAKYNIGVNPTKLNKWEDWQGKYFAWGEIEEKEVYNWSTYKWGGDEHAMKLSDYILKYAGFQDKELELCDDAAYMNTRGKYITPTAEQFSELLKNCNIEYIHPALKGYGYNQIVTYDGHELFTDGYMFTSKINEKKLFFPCSDIKSDNDVTEQNLHLNDTCNALYWTRSLYDSGSGHKLTQAFHAFYSHGDMHKYVSVFDRSAGLPIRPVLNK